MSDLTGDAHRILGDIAARYGLSTGAVEEMARAVARGGGTMAQFNIPELGGSGQWMMGGMTMVGDMFNHGLKAQVDNLCAELSNIMAGTVLFQVPQTFGGGAWWPSELGQPSSTGGQNSVRYAYFPNARRIAFDPGNGGPVILLDTLDHQIGGWGQQQSGPGDPFAGISFSSQYGQYALSSLPQASIAGGASAQSGASTQAAAPQSAAPQQDVPPQPQPAPWAPEPQPAPPVDAAPWTTEPQAVPAPPPSQPPAAPSSEARAGGDVIGLIERLAALHKAGVLTDDEFQTKKAELLSRL
ncbi:hypothetical protein ATO13_00645 [Stappia sp. 22II-S9-Z10]|nr:hypothetical protein ATO13_00645 [Stappia sp. 22II-S9-Z10]